MFYLNTLKTPSVATTNLSLIKTSAALDGSLCICLHLSVGLETIVCVIVVVAVVVVVGGGGGGGGLNVVVVCVVVGWVVGCVVGDVRVTNTWGNVCGCLECVCIKGLLEKRKGRVAACVCGGLLVTGAKNIKTFKTN